MNVSLTIAIYLREVRSWRHRFWWLPLLGMLSALLPVALTPPPMEEYGAVSWFRGRGDRYEDSDTTFLSSSPVPAKVLTVTVCVACALSLLLAAWLARELRGAEVRNATLMDVAITSIRPLELAVAQIAAAWTIAVMPLVGAAPVLVPCGVRVGMGATETLGGLFVLFGAPLAGACIGYAGFWWKRLVLVASRGRSFRLWMIGVFALATVTCWVIAVPLTYPLWYRIQKGMPTDSRFKTPYFEDVFLTNLVVGVWLLAVLWLLFCVVRGLWRRGWKGRIVLLLIVALGVTGAVKSKPYARLKRSIPTWSVMTMSSSPLEWWLSRFDTTLADVPTFPAITASLAFGGEYNLGFSPRSRPEITRQQWNAIIDKMILVGGAFWLTLALGAVLFALGDLGWVLRQPWLVEALRRPEAAPMMVEFGGDGLRRREGNYVFETRNPVYDYALARSGDSRVVLMAWFVLIVIGSAVALFLRWNDFVKYQPMSDALDNVLPRTWSFVAVLCWMCGLNCGLTIAHLKSSLQWWSLLSLPVKFRSVLWGICFPRLVDALFIIGAAFSLVVVGVILRSLSFSLTSDYDYYYGERYVSYSVRRLVNFFDLGRAIVSYHSWGQWLPLALNVLTLTFVGLATSLFAASRSKGPAKATVLAVILSALVVKAIPYGYYWLVGWQTRQWSRFQTWGVESLPPPLQREPWASIGAYVPYLAPMLLSLFLLWWGIRRLKRET